ncbi:Lar family restriction alleviation protein [Pseudomonas aeruginosa]
MDKVLVDRELLPCPFCGGEARLDQRVTQSLWNSSDAVFSHVACDECDISGQDFCDDPDGEEASEWWNRRAQPAVTQDDQTPIWGYAGTIGNLIAQLRTLDPDMEIYSRIGWRMGVLCSTA